MGGYVVKATKVLILNLGSIKYDKWCCPSTVIKSVKYKGGYQGLSITD